MKSNLKITGKKSNPQKNFKNTPILFYFCINLHLICTLRVAQNSPLEEGRVLQKGFQIQKEEESCFN